MFSQTGKNIDNLFRYQSSYFQAELRFKLIHMGNRNLGNYKLQNLTDVYRSKVERNVKPPIYGEKTGGAPAQNSNFENYDIFLLTLGS